MTQKSDHVDQASLETAYQFREVGRYLESLKIFREHAQKGDAYAQVQLGDMLDRGLGGERNPLEARKWLEAAASSGDSYHRLRFARFLEREREPEAAFKLISELANEGYSPAVYRLAKYLEVGFGTQKDLIGAERYMVDAAKLGHFRAMRSLAVAELKGHKGFWRIPRGVVRFFSTVGHVASLHMREPDSPNLKL